MNHKLDLVKSLNADFGEIVRLLDEYIEKVNSEMKNFGKIEMSSRQQNIGKVFERFVNRITTFVNFNYTETLSHFGYANEDNTIYIHGRASQNEKNPIIFGYGDETDPIYQQIEDSGENVFLEHVKSFSYLKTSNYRRLISLIDSEPYDVVILGHSCGLSDRILLSEIFEHNNCLGIEIFYHQRADGANNYTEITHEISRHFKPQNKGMMRRRVKPIDKGNIIPQGSRR